MILNQISASSIAVRSRLQKGSVIIELAFVLVPFLAMLFAIAEFAVPIFLHSTFNAAVREGVRLGVTYNTTYNGTAYSTQTDAIKAVVRRMRWAS
jgi:Flp pilus assembly protein TadG